MNDAHPTPAPAPAAALPRRPGPGLRACIRILAAWCLGAVLVTGVGAQSSRMAASASGLEEAGAPLFAVVSREAVGLASAPTDLKVLPDGRVLLVAGRELAFGDGTRWEVYAQDPAQDAAHGLTVGIDDDGKIYQSVDGGFARVDFGRDGLWRLVETARWPTMEGAESPAPRHVIATGDTWYWHASSGMILAWRPGQPARAMRAATTVETIFRLHGVDYLSDRSAPSIELLTPGPEPGLLRTANRSAPELITCVLPLPDGRALAGTAGRGIQVIEGATVRPMAPGGALGVGRHIRDLCAAAPGLFAAAIDGEGVIFFDLEGRVRQALPRSLDHRLARIIRLVPGRGGVLWGLLADSIVRIAFPSRISHYGPILSTALMEAQPARLDGRLWLLSDRRALRAVYDASGLITGMEADTPGDQALFMLSTLAGTAIATTDHGAFYRSAEGWRPIPDAPRNLYLLGAAPVDGQWLYGARDELGWLRLTPDGPRLQRHPVPGLGLIYHAETDAAGAIWVERGIASIARIVPGRPGGLPPEVTLLGESEGVPRGWAQVFCIDGAVRFNIADLILHRDAAGARIVPDHEFVRRFSEYGTIVGRPGRDALGRLWITTERGIHLFEGSLDTARLLEERPDPGFQPWYLTFQDDGIVWMHAPGKLARYDPGMAAPPGTPSRAIITRFGTSGSRMTVHDPTGEIAPIDYADNSISAHFMAPGNPFSTTTSFEVKLAGAAGQGTWLPAGTSGSAVFDQLKEGRYVLHVRPRSGDRFGAEAQLAFTVLAPWYRSPFAYAGYGFTAIGVILLSAWLPAYLGRREQMRLERLVAQRTRELQASQDQLRRAVESGSIGLWEFDATRLRFTWNEQCTAICGLPAGTTEVDYATFQALIDPSERAVIEEAFRTAAAAGQTARMEHRIRRADGTERWVIAIGRSAPDPAGGPPGMRGAMLDITERKQAEEAIRSLNATLERRVAERTAALEATNRELEATNRELESFSYSVSHDLRAPLRGIDGWSHALEEDCGSQLDQTGLAHLARVRAECRRLNTLIEDLLKLSRTTRAEYHAEPVDLSALVARIADRVAASWPTARVEFVCQPGLGTRGDAALLEVALTNLLDNAWKFSSKAERSRVEFGVTKTVEGPAFFVRDNGAGFDSRHASKLFGAFQRMHTQDEFPGTGVGLATVQRIIHRHGGRIWAESTPGVQTTFYFTLPAPTG